MLDVNVSDGLRQLSLG
jgi:hypothetical protein